MAKNETEIKEVKVEDKKEEPTTVIVEEKEGTVRKIITICLKGLAFVATGVAGFFIGRHSVNSGEDAKEETTEE